MSSLLNERESELRLSANTGIEDQRKVVAIIDKVSHLNQWLLFNAKKIQPRLEHFSCGSTDPLILRAKATISQFLDDCIELRDKVAESIPTAIINMVLFCPACGEQHIDKPEALGDYTARMQDPNKPQTDLWTNPPHRTHLCHYCGEKWRPSNTATNGVRHIFYKECIVNHVRPMKQKEIQAIVAQRDQSRAEVDRLKIRRWPRDIHSPTLTKEERADAGRGGSYYHTVRGQSDLTQFLPRGWRIEARLAADDEMCWLIVTSPNGSSAGFSADAKRICGQVITHLAEAMRKGGNHG